MITIQDRTVGNVRLRLVRREDPNPVLPDRYYLVLGYNPDPKWAMFRRYETGSQSRAELLFQRTYEKELAARLRLMEHVA